MTMTPDELRALADALCVRHYDLATVDVIRAADYLRAQAEAKPVAWRTFDGEGNYDYRAYELNEDYADEWNRRNPNHVGWVEPLYAHPAPAAPQADPAIKERGPWSADREGRHIWIESNDFTHDVRLYVNGDFESNDHRFAYAQEIARRLNAAPAVPQAEPKREPLTDEQITKGEYVLATKFGDGDPGDHWGVGFYDRFANGRHYVVDSAGKQIRGNGFRRVGRITVEVGRWLLSAGKSLEASPPGTVNLWTMLTERAHGIGGSDAE